MQQYKVEFFENYVSPTTETRRLRFVHHDFANGLSIDDDYLSAQTNGIEIRSTDRVKAGHFIRILKDNSDYFFGIVTDAEPGEYITKVQFKPFIAIFDSKVLFNVLAQWRSDSNHGLPLEQVLQTYITAYFISNNDYRQLYPITVSIPESGLTVKWNMNIQPDSDDAPWAIVGLYNELIVRALKEYGIVITVTPNFTTGKIDLLIGKISGVRHIDVDLPNVLIKTFKINDRPYGTNKLVIYNALDYNESIVYLVRKDRSWGRSDQVDDEDRIVPVVYDIRTATPDGTYQDPDVDFAYAAESVAYDELSGLRWDNLIELNVSSTDPTVKPTTIPNGQEMIIHHNGESYRTILTGKNISPSDITLIFGSERILYTKRTSK